MDVKRVVGEVIYVAAVAAAAVLAADRTALEPAWAAVSGAVVALARQAIAAWLAKRLG
jgi:hypothetical protein